MAELVRLNMTKPDILMSALINCNNNYTGRRYGAASFARNAVEKKSNIGKRELKNVTPPKKKFTQLELNFEEGVNE